MNVNGCLSLAFSVVTFASTYLLKFFMFTFLLKMMQLVLPVEYTPATWLNAASQMSNTPYPRLLFAVITFAVLAFIYLIDSHVWIAIGLPAIACSMISLAVNNSLEIGTEKLASLERAGHEFFSNITLFEIGKTIVALIFVEEDTLWVDMDNAPPLE
jgi:hypothetical protein